MPTGTSTTSSAVNTKSKLLGLSRKVNRGLTETPEERAEILKLFEQLEKSSLSKSTLASKDLSAVWNLEYTTSDAILGRNDVPKFGPVLQTIDAGNLKAKNAEVRLYFGFLKVPVEVTANLTPTSPSRVDVQFKQFTIGPVSFPAPNSFQSWLDVTYVDRDIRLSRGAKGNIFVLSRYSELDNSNSNSIKTK